MSETKIKDKHIIDLLKSRDGIATTIKLTTSVLTVWNIAWGYDMGEEYAHVTTNISPGIDGVGIHFFLTTDILIIEDPVHGKILFAQNMF